MSVEQGGTIRHWSRRRYGPPVGHDITVRVGPSCEDTPALELDHWLSGRWRAWSRLAGRDCTVAAEHPPWVLHEATVVDLHEDLLDGGGLIRPEAAPRVRYAPGTDARLGLPQPSRS